MPRRKESNGVSGPARVGRVFEESLVKVRTALQMGAFQSGDLLPPERDLSERYGISRSTMRKVLTALVQEGTLTCRPRVGYAVSGRAVQAGQVATSLIGLIHKDFAHLACGHRYMTVLQSLLEQSGHTVLLSASGRETDRENISIRQFRTHNVVGLVLTPALTGDQSTELEQWIHDGRPAVLLGHPGPWRLPNDVADLRDQVDVDNRNGIEQAFRYLVSLGHRDIGLISVQPFDNSERYQAFTETAKAAGVRCQGKWLLPSVDRGRAGGRDAFIRIREQGALPTAMLCTGDDEALGFMEAVSEAGLRCPEDISVVGFGNESNDGPESLAKLTTVDHSKDTMAHETARCLRKQFAGDLAHSEKIRVEAHLVIRESAALPRRKGGGR